MSRSEWIDAVAASEALGVSRSTLYAYVSRGSIRSRPAAGAPREKRYAREDVERLRLAAAARKRPEKDGERALQWGLPVLESALTLIDDDAVYYRGIEVAGLARERSLEDVAALLWNGGTDLGFLDTQLHVVSGRAVAENLPFLSRAQSVLPLVGARDPLAFDRREKAVAQTGWRILNLLASVAGETATLEETLEETLAQRWNARGRTAPAILRAAMILSADDALDVCALAVRCAASAGSSPYAVVLAGLAAVEGTGHAGVTMRVAALFDELRRERQLERALAERLRRGEPVEGFGGALFPGGDPRATILLEMLPPSKEHQFALSLSAAAAAVVGEQPTLAFALVAVERALALPEGSALTLFALGRSMGWIGHAIEQYALNAAITPRSRYVGEMP